MMTINSLNTTAEVETVSPSAVIQHKPIEYPTQKTVTDLTTTSYDAVSNMFITKIANQNGFTISQNPPEIMVELAKRNNNTMGSVINTSA